MKNEYLTTFVEIPFRFTGYVHKRESVNVKSEETVPPMYVEA